MKESIKKIFEENKQLISLAERVTRNLKKQNFDAGLRNGIAVLDKMTGMLEVLLAEAGYFNESGIVYVDMANINEMLTEVLSAQQNMDYVLLSDLYELRLQPFFSSLQQAIFQNEAEAFVAEGKNYQEECLNIKAYDEELYYLLKKAVPYKEEKQLFQVELTSYGEFTLAGKSEEKTIYYHSNHKPQQAAYELAASWYEEDRTEYVVYGFGLGYHALELGSIDPNVSITVYESREEVLRLALEYGVLSSFLKKSNHKIIYDKDFTKLQKRIGNLSEQTSFVIHYPSLQNLEKGALKEKLENYFLQYSSIKNQRKLLCGNFRENVRKCSKTAEELKDSWVGKDIYIIAAGPSLDKNFVQLKKVKKEKGIILAVGTVFRKLMKAGIEPDYVVISEANERVIGQISGLENAGVPLLLLSTAFHGFASQYQGSKYLIFQKDFPMAEEEADSRGTFLCETGGSVATVAIDLSVKMGAARIICVGLDLAYSNHFVHASDTSRRELTVTENLRQIRDIYGEKVYTSQSMDKYRQWIEARIKRESTVIFLNATEGGANISGMKNVILENIVRQ
ncbi:motility associated factor glycosyltransferase family protein [Anaeromicropila populeti]|uniref:6-hydroxymethylpterin diphosphokinase MptE-like domain-containing protein n=1 Tax=Anaeromicropila populeti TaxID=37658 RepID=A0A1I6HWJ7_9FIRM|nr:6-hydroxymethylpterin diphosphokinase MptE-like protein [Anaeromicropila populeti]SFR58815.1 Protein of unknown function DUF115 [Anaeromicropila populeti]